MIKENRKKKILIPLFLLEILVLFFCLVISLHGGEGSDRVEVSKTLGKEYFPDALCEPSEVAFSGAYRQDLPQDVFLEMKGSHDAKKSDVIPLPSGDYVLTVDYSCHTDDNGIIICQVLADGEKRILASSVPESRSSQSEILFTVEDDSQPVIIALLCKDEEGFSIFRADLFSVSSGVSSAAKVISVILLWIGLCAIANLFVFFFLDHPDERKIYLILAASVVLLSLPVLIPPYYFRNAHDLHFHVMRIFGTREGILRGTVFTKMQSAWYHGYGYPISACYGDMFLYPSALASIAGLPIEGCYRFMVVLINCLTVFSSYYCFKKVFGRSGAFAGTIVYVFFFYRIIDIYRRAAIGEFLAIAFLPFLVAAVFYLYKDMFGQSLVHFVVGFTGLLNSHILTTEMVLFALTVFLLSYGRRTFVARRLLSLIVSAIAVLLANLGFIVPFLDTVFRNNMMVLHSDQFQILPSENGIRFETLFGSGKNTTYIIAAMPIICLLLLIFVFCYFESKKKREDGVSAGKKRRLTVFTIFTGLYLLMSTAYFPWDLLMKIPFVDTFVASIQFPWRWLAFADLFGALAICEIFSGSSWKESSSVMKKALVSVTSLCVILGTVFGFLLYISFDRTSLKRPENIDWIHISNHEYMISGTDIYGFTRKYRVSGDASVTDFSKDGEKISFRFESGEDAYIDIPLLNYSHYQAQITESRDTSKKNIEIQNGENNRIRIPLPENGSGRVEISFHTPIYWVVSYLISVISVFVILVTIFRKKRNQPST